jgi:hypothetical protein
MAEVMFSLANEINGALQAIVGHCELLAREYPDPALPARPLDGLAPRRAPPK